MCENCKIQTQNGTPDSDVNVECVLTEQLLQIRKSLKGSFKGCDIYKPKKPKGLATMVLDEWKRYYPDSEETNKTIGMLYKYKYLVLTYVQQLRRACKIDFVIKFVAEMACFESAFRKQELTQLIIGII